MGNDSCCNNYKYDYELVDSQEEIFIREKLNEYSRKLCTLQQIKKICVNLFSLLLLDLEGDPINWITEKQYKKFICDIFNVNEKEYENIYIKLSYNNSNKNISVAEYTKNFHLLICMWLIGISTKKTMNISEKENMIKNIIIKSSNYLTFSTFQKFLLAYLEIMLIEITSNFKEHNPKEINDLISGIFNVINVNNYAHCLFNDMKNIIIQKTGLNEDSKIKNEFITDEFLKAFCEDKKFLFNSLELRNNFYNKYRK